MTALSSVKSLVLVSRCYRNTFLRNWYRFMQIGLHFCKFVQSSHVETTQSHMHSNGNAEECPKTARVVLCKQNWT